VNDIGRTTLRAAGVAVAATAALLTGEVAWVVHRDLPAFEGADASGSYVPPDGEGDARPVVVAALGDSTLTGPGLDDVHDLWLWQALAGVAPPHPVELRSFAVGGSRIADVRQRLGAALAVAPDVVVLAAGSNDAIHGTPRHRFARDLEAVVHELSGAVPVVAVANVGDLGNLERVPKPLSWILRQRARGIRREIERVVARHHGVVLLDVAASDDGFRRGGVFVADRFHPNAAGHQLWASCAEPGLEEALARAATLA
jgi:lysophospholipase L1-like esterase